MTRTRLLFFDNLRFAMATSIVAFHAACSYTDMVPFWPFHDAQTSRVLDILLMLLDIGVMIMFFFIAGYFALPSLRKKGSWTFLKGKLKRLGIPWLLIVVFVLPALDYAHTTHYGIQRAAYGDHWIASLAKIAEFRFGFLDMSQYLPMPEQFYQRYVWFLPVLLTFFAGFCLLYEARRRWMPSIRLGASGTPRWVTLPAFVLLTAACSFVADWLLGTNVSNWKWFTLGNVIQFQTIKLVFYASYFALGVYAYVNDWFAGGKGMGRLAFWGPACMLSLVGLMPMGKTLIGTPSPSTPFLASFSLLYAFLSLSFVAVLVSFATRYWNRSYLLNQKLTSNAYNIYLVHYVPVMLLPLLLRDWMAPALVKWGIVALSSIGLSLGFGEWVLKATRSLSSDRAGAMYASE